MKISALDAYKRPIVGTLIKTYEKGITIDYDRGVRWYVTNDRVVGEVTEEDRLAQPDGAQEGGE